MGAIKMLKKPDAYYLNFLILIFLLFFCRNAVGQPNAWINEFHYDNDGSDINEGIELVIESPGSWNMALFRVDLYNGLNGTSYFNNSVDNFTLGASTGSYTFYSLIIDGIQNGAPDGMALSYDGTLIQFFSYEGAFTATDGPAIGQTSIDIGVSESTVSTVGYSLQLSGTSANYSGFNWQAPAIATIGTINNAQTITNILTPTISLISPVGGEEYYAGDTLSVLWSAQNVAIIDILLYNPFTKLWSVLADNVTNDSSENILIPDDALYNTEYRIAIVDTSNYLISDTSGVLTINSRLLDSDSYIATSGIQIPEDTIVVVDGDSKSEAFPVLSFVLVDNASGDGVSTELRQIVLFYGVNNTANFESDIDSGYFEVDGIPVELSGDPIIGIDSIVFPIAVGQIIVPDGGNIIVTIHLILSENSSDGNVIQLVVDADKHGFIASSNGSIFSSTFPVDVIGNNITIDVLATALQFNQQPSSVLIRDTIKPSVILEAIDAHGNIDTDYNSEISIKSVGANLQYATHTALPINGKAIFDSLVFTTSGKSVSLIASAPNLSNSTSMSFEVFPLSSTNADLSSIKIEGSELSGFNPIRLNYTVALPYNTVIVPVVTYTLADTLASAIITNANTLPGTTSINIEADNGKTRIYLIDFELETNSIEARSHNTIFFYPSPVYSELTVINNLDYKSIHIFDLAGKLVCQRDFNGIDQLIVNVSMWNSGMYIIKASSEKYITTQCFIKE